MAENRTTPAARKSKQNRRAPGTLGTTQQLPSGRWRAFYRLNGQRITAPHTFATKDDALNWLAAERADRARGVWRDPEAGNVTLATFANDWLDTRPDLAARTLAHYRGTVKRWLTRPIGKTDTTRGIDLGALPLSEITPARVRSWFAAVTLEARASATARLTSDRNAGKHPARVWAQHQGLRAAATGRVSPEVLEAWKRAGEPRIEERTTAPENPGERAAANAYSLLRAILNIAVQDGLIVTNPCQIRGAGQSHARERGTANPDEVAALAQHMPRRYSAAVILAAWSGLRFGELFALARRHVDLDAGTLTVERQLIRIPANPETGTPQSVGFGKTKTAKSRRTVHIPRGVLTVLSNHMAEHVPQHPDALLFTLENGAPVSNARISMHLKRARAAIGRDDLTWHDLRHTGATLAYRAGASVPEVQARLGHTTMRASQIYAHATEDSDRLIAEGLDAFYVEPAARHLRAI